MSSRSERVNEAVAQDSSAKERGGVQLLRRWRGCVLPCSGGRWSRSVLLWRIVRGERQGEGTRGSRRRRRWTVERQPGSLFVKLLVLRPEQQSALAEDNAAPAWSVHTDPVGDVGVL